VVARGIVFNVDDGNSPSVGDARAHVLQGARRLELPGGDGVDQVPDLALDDLPGKRVDRRVGQDQQEFHYLAPRLAPASSGSALAVSSWSFGRVSTSSDFVGNSACLSRASSSRIRRRRSSILL